jgi:hypothetical protein
MKCQAELETIRETNGALNDAYSEKFLAFVTEKSSLKKEKIAVQLSLKQAKESLQKVNTDLLQVLNETRKSL